MLRTVSQRLTLWYSLLFAALSLGAFLLVYVQLAAGLDRQTDERLQAKAREFARTYRTRGVKGLRLEFATEANGAGKRRVFFRLLGPDGTRQAASDACAWKGLAASPIQHPACGGRIQTLHLPGRRFAVRMLCSRLDDGSLLQIAASIKENEMLLEAYRETFSTVFFILLSCGGLGAYFISRRAMAGVRQVTAAAASIAAGHLDQPLPPGKRGAEIENLTAAFNTMQRRITALIAELTTVIDNVAHDLRMPITRIRGMAETTLSGENNLAAFRDMAVAVIEESDRLVAMVNTILELAQIDAGTLPLPDEAVDLAQVVREAAELFLPAGEDRGIDLRWQVPTEPLFIRGDVRGMQRVVANLLDNAVKYTPAGGRVDLQVSASAEEVTLMVSDSGVGIDEDAMRHVFDRFYRGDASRSTPGSGLGLSLAHAIVTAHHGRITVTSQPNMGSRFLVALPRITPPAG